jgi:tetratricopeptide (TPR) repeat protein
MVMARVMCGMLLCALVVASGCDRTSDPTRAERAVKRRTFGHTSHAPANHAPVTLEDCQRIVLAIDGCFADGNAAAADMLIDWDAVLTAATRGQEVPAEARQSLIQAIAGENGLFGSIEAEVASGGSFELLRWHFDRSGNAGIWYRLRMQGGALNYYDLQLGRDAHGSVRIRDVFIAAFGDTLANTLRLVVPHSLVGAGRNRSEIRERDARHFAALVQIGEMRKRMENEDFSGAIDIYHRLPEQMKAHKRVIMMRLRCALVLDEAEQLSAIQFAESENRPAGHLDLMLMLAYQKRRDFAAANACIDRLNRLIGGDPDLSNERILNLLEAGQTAEARRDSDLAISLAPYSGANLQTAILVAQRQHDFARMTILLDALEAGGIELPDIANLPFYDEFRRSPEFAAWQADRAAAMGVQNAGEEISVPEVAAEYSPWPRVQ